MENKQLNDARFECEILQEGSCITLRGFFREFLYWLETEQRLSQMKEMPIRVELPCSTDLQVRITRFSSNGDIDTVLGQLQTLIQDTLEEMK